MDELLNKYGLPDDVGFIMSLDMLCQLYDSEEDYLNAIEYVKNRIDVIKENYGINSIDLAFKFSIAVQSVNEKKRIVLNKEDLINSIADYFTHDLVTALSEREYLIFSGNEHNELIEEKIESVKDLLSISISELKNVKTIDDLRIISDYLYNAYLKVYNEEKNKKIYFRPWHLWFPNEIQNDIAAFTRMKRWLPELIDDLSKKTINNNIFDKINIDKFKLFLTCQYITLGNPAEEPYRSLLIHNAIEIFNSIQDKETSLDELILVGYDYEHKNYAFLNYGYMSYDEMHNSIDRYLANPLGSNVFNAIKGYKKDNQNSIDYNKVYSDLKNIIDIAIEKSNEMGQQDVSLQDISNDAKEKLKNEKSVEKQNQLKSFIDRSEFYINEPNFYRCQKGNGIFRNSHILYYNNGVVAIDTLNGYYGYLYVMPINVYFDIISNNKVKNLIELRSIIAVTPISHKKLNWKEIAHNVIQNHVIKPHEFEMLQSINGISLPVNDMELEKAKERYQNNEYIYKKIIDKEKERRDKYKEIDDELKEKDNSDYDEIQERAEESLLLDAEDEIKENVSNPSDFISIYDYKNKIETKRNPKVSLNTKLRTMDERMAMKCEMCGKYESYDTRNFETHHIIPLSKDGIDNLYNTVCLCGDCHNKIHSRVPFTYEEKWQMLMNVRKNIEKSTPYYLRDFDRLFNPNYNAIYNNNDLSEEELLKQYDEEQKYYIEHKQEEDEKFLTEFNHFKK